MTIITEYRWKCDYCGNCSPPLEPIDKEYQKRAGATHRSPMGWVRIKDMAFGGGPNIPGVTAAYVVEVRDAHFCIPTHRDMWLADRGILEP